MGRLSPLLYLYRPETLFVCFIIIIYLGFTSGLSMSMAMTQCLGCTVVAQELAAAVVYLTLIEAGRCSLRPVLHSSRWSKFEALHRRDRSLIVQSVTARFIDCGYLAAVKSLQHCSTDIS